MVRSVWRVQGAWVGFGETQGCRWCMRRHSFTSLTGGPPPLRNEVAHASDLPDAFIGLARHRLSSSAECVNLAVWRS